MSIDRGDTLLTPELIATHREAGHWSDLTVSDVFRRNATTNGGDVAYIDDREQTTWSELWSASGAIAAGLSAAGIGRGDVVAVQLPNRIEFVQVLVAINRLGAVICQFPPDYRSREVEFILGFSEAKAVVVPDTFRGFDHLEMVDTMRDRLPRLGTAIAVPTGEGPEAAPAPGWTTLATLQAAAGSAVPTPDRPASADDVMRIAFTSGTTGDPKAVMHTANTTLFTNLRGNQEWGIDSRSTILVLLPVGLNVGLFAVLQTALAGARAVLMERFEPSAALSLVERFGVTTFLAAPTALIALLRDQTLDNRDLSSLSLVQTGGAATPLAVLDEANRRLGCPVVDVYGMLESGWTSSTRADEPYTEWAGTVGRPYPWLKVRVVGNDGTDQPVGTEGEIIKTGPTMTVGYYRNREKNEESWTSDGWFRSGDRGFFDDAGRLTISGRSKDMIIHGGANIWPRELEEVLFRHPDIADVAVVGIHDDYFGENVCVCVVPRPGAVLTLPDVVAFMKDEVAKYKLPQHLETFDAFPLGPTGKVLKVALAEQVEVRRAEAPKAVPGSSHD